MSEVERYKVIPVSGIGTGPGMYAVFDTDTGKKVSGLYYWRDAALQQAELLNSSLQRDGVYED